MKLSTPDRNGKYEKTAEEVAKALGRSRYAIQSVRRKLVKASKLAGGSRKQLIELLLVGEHRLAKLRTAKIPGAQQGRRVQAQNGGTEIKKDKRVIRSLVLAQVAVSPRKSQVTLNLCPGLPRDAPWT